MSLTFRITEKVPEPSICIEELNTKLTKMRKIVREAKLFVLRDLMRYTKKLKMKISKINNKDKIQRKLDQRILDIGTLKRLSVNRLCKRLLAEEVTDDSLDSCKKKSTDKQDRLIQRLKNTKPIFEFVTSFRKEHPDWQSLVHYLLYKNTSGKWKTKTQKSRSKKVYGYVPLPPLPVNVKDGEMTAGVSQPLSSYRVEANSMKQLDCHEDDGSDVDSDAASDIADILISKFCTKSAVNNSQRVPSVTGCPTSKVNAKLKSTKKSADVYCKNFVNGTNDDNSSVVIVQKVESSKCILESDDENPLGNDDVNFKSRQHQEIDRKRYANPKRRGHVPSKPLVRKPRPPHRVGVAPFQDVPTELAKPNLHPSWQAKREQKVRLDAVANKRIVFDD